MMCVEGARYISLWVPVYALQRYNVTQTLATQGFACNVFENWRVTSNLREKYCWSKRRHTNKNVFKQLYNRIWIVLIDFIYIYMSIKQNVPREILETLYVEWWIELFNIFFICVCDKRIILI